MKGKNCWPKLMYGFILKENQRLRVANEKNFGQYGSKKWKSQICCLIVLNVKSKN